MRTKVGSNQYKTKYKGLKPRTWKNVTLAFAFMAAVAYVGHESVISHETFKVSPIPEVYSVETSFVPQVEAEEVEFTSEQEQIRGYIKEVFGKDADKAFKVLSCENAKLNPKAVNTAGNVPAGSRDIGVFQINEYWQGVNAKFLFEPKINVMIAHKIFTDNGHSFERWTCGRKLGV